MSGAPREFDVLVAGGGLVGATLALALAELPLRIGVIEARPPSAVPPTGGGPRAATAPPPGTGDDPRCTALAHGSMRILDALGVWSRLGAAATPIRTIHVSDRGHFGNTRLRCEDYGLGALGHVVENRLMAHALWALLGLTGEGPGAAARDAVTEAGPTGGGAALTAFAPASVVAADCGAAGASVRVRGEDGTEHDLRAALLVVADGVRSAVRRMLGIGAQVRAYRQQAIIANVTPERFHDYTAFERFTASGPLALLPMSSGRCSLVWTVWNDDAADRLALGDHEFLEALQSQFGYRLGRFVGVGPRSAYPLSLVSAGDVLPPRCVLVGNAATGLHPVAGQGLNLGLRDVARLAELIAEQLARGTRDVGNGLLVDAARAWQQRDRTRVVAFTDGLVRLFTQPGVSVRLARSAGLVALELIPPARSVLARQAMGLGGRVPRLARGLPLLDAQGLHGLREASPGAPASALQEAGKA